MLLSSPVVVVVATPRNQHDPLDLFVHRVLYRRLETQHRVRLDALVKSSNSLFAENVPQQYEGAAILVVGLDGGGDAVDGEGYGEVGPFGEAAEDEVGEGADVGVARDVRVAAQTYFCEPV